MEARTDLTRLAQLMSLPTGVRGARWVAEAAAPPGSELVPGPTDTVLTVALALDAAGWTALEQQLGASTGRAQLALSAQVARALELAPAVSGAGYHASALSNIFNHAELAVRVEDRLVLQLRSR